MNFGGCSLLDGGNPSKNGVPACFGAKTLALTHNVWGARDREHYLMTINLA